MLSSLAGRALRTLGYTVSRTRKDEDLALYRQLYGDDAIAGRRFYNVGAGLFRHSAWTNVDFASEWYGDNTVDINHDLLACTPLPIPTGTAEMVYSSHTIEHITNDAARNLFHEAHRVLKPGGFIRLTTPSIELYYRSVLLNDRHLWKWDIDVYSQPEHMARAGIAVPLKDVSIKQIFLFSFASQTSVLHSDSARKISDAEFDAIFAQPLPVALDECIARCDLNLHRRYPGNHINWWSWDKASEFLREAGFSDVYISGYGQSSCAVLRDTAFFDSTHPAISLHVEARKT